MNLCKYVFGLIMVLACGSVSAETIRMVQADKTFLGNITDKEAADAFDNPAIEEKNKVEVLKAKVGDSIVFVNRDEVTHNVSGSVNSEQVFDVKLQDPGPKNDRAIKLSKKGEYTIECAIHPKMKFKVQVD